MNLKDEGDMESFRDIIGDWVNEDLQVIPTESYTFNFVLTFTLISIFTLVSILPVILQYVRLEFMTTARNTVLNK